MRRISLAKLRNTERELAPVSRQFSASASVNCVQFVTNHGDRLTVKQSKRAGASGRFEMLPRCDDVQYAVKRHVQLCGNDADRD